MTTGYNNNSFDLFPGPLLVIVEFAKNGNLRDFLESCRDGVNGYGKFVSPQDPCWYTKTPGGQIISRKSLISFAYQIARGMEFLASKKVILNLLLHVRLLDSNFKLTAVLINEHMQVSIKGPTSIANIRSM